MADLKTCLKGMGAENISTILASGNVWLDWEGTEPELHEKCEAVLNAAAARETTTMRNLNTIEKMLAKA